MTKEKKPNFVREQTKNCVHHHHKPSKSEKVVFAPGARGWEFIQSFLGGWGGLIWNVVMVIYITIIPVYIYYSLYWAPVGANKWFKYIWVLLQVNSLFVTTSSYPNRKTLTYRKVNFRESLHIYLKNNREEFCIITKRLIKKCDSYKRKPLDREYPSLCTLLQPLKTME